MSLRHAQIASLVSRTAGWTTDPTDLPDWKKGRVRLSEVALSRAMAALGQHPPNDQRPYISTYLDQIFAQTVDVERERCRTLHALVVDRARAGALGKRRPPKGLPARLQDRMEVWQKLHKDLVKAGARPAEIAVFLRELYSDRELFKIMNLAMMETSRRQLLLFWRPKEQQPLFQALDRAFDQATTMLKGAITRGNTDPAFEQMTRALAALYYKVLGKPPGRSWKEPDKDFKNDENDVEDPKGREQGPFLMLVRVMAKAVNDALPPEHRRTRPPDMAKTVRLMVKELKAELADATSAVNNGSI